MNEHVRLALRVQVLNSLTTRARIPSLLLLVLAACLSSGALPAGEQLAPQKDAAAPQQSTAAALPDQTPARVPALPVDAATPKQSTAAPPVAKKNQKKAPKKLNGAELYALHCNRCHPERYAPERTAEQWKTILLHMRTRANIPAEQARAILEYLQEDSGK